MTGRGESKTLSVLAHHYGVARAKPFAHVTLAFKSVRVMSGSDLRLATVLLRGFLEEDTRKRRRTRYLKEGSREDLDARRALAGLLRSKTALDQEVRLALASLVDPNPPDAEQRKIIFASRRRGKLVDHVANTQIYSHVSEAVKSGASAASAIVDASEKFSISEEMVKRIWGRFRRIYGPPARKTAR